MQQIERMWYEEHSIAASKIFLKNVYNLNSITKPQTNLS